MDSWKPYNFGIIKYIAKDNPHKIAEMQPPRDKEIIIKTTSGNEFPVILNSLHPMINVGDWELWKIATTREV